MSDAPLHAFTYDSFQQQAIDAIDREQSLFVAAPTGAGKTVLADYVIERALQRRQRVIYTAPIKALSNQKYRDFSARHGEHVGILTGDVTIHPRAPLVIMTTEIYRNTLLEDPTQVAPYAWIIFDEIHYLDDAERGTVWEEAMLLSPPHIRLLCLSATIPNVQELAAWIREAHRRPVEVVESPTRPVPLTFQFQCRNRILATPDALKAEGYHGQEGPVRRPRFHRPLRRSGRFHREETDAPHPNRLDRLVRHLHDTDRLPGILFTFGRRRTEELAWEASGLSLVTPEEAQALQTMYDTLCERFQVTHDATAQALRRLVIKGVAYHHAGMLPTVKEVIERCFTSRQLKLIVTTETFALGINMPARSVVLDALQKRSAAGYTLLRRREFLQMAGRAGRRGMDTEGSVYLRINPAHVSFSDVLHLLRGQSEPVHSRLNTAYATLLNLYRHHGPALVELFPRTLYYFQTTGARRAAGLELIQRKLALLEQLGYLAGTRLTRKGQFAAWLFGYELLLTELQTAGHLATLDPIALAMLITAIVYEPRPGLAPPRPHRLAKRLARLCEEPITRIHRAEAKFQLVPKTKTPAFGLSFALEAWMQRTPFARLTRLCEADEGEIVRYFRMAVQLLRQLSDLPAAEPRLRATAASARERINRDVIDAEAQLRLG